MHMARQRRSESDRVSRFEFMEFQKETKSDFIEIRRGIAEQIDIAYDRFSEAVERLERAVHKSEDRIMKAIDKSEDRLKAEREAAEKRQQEIESRNKEERKEFSRDRKWMIAIFIAILALIASALGLLPDALYNFLP